MTSISTGIRCESSPNLYPIEPTKRECIAALFIALALVAITRFPVARSAPVESDEFGFLVLIQEHWFPMHHTLFLTLARACAEIVGDPYLGFIALDIVMSALALVASWWWSRGLFDRRMAFSATLMLGVAPLFWGYGAVAANYTVSIFVGSALLGIALRTWRSPSSWHPYAASAIFAFGCGYRSDIGTLWCLVYLLILWRHRWATAIKAGLLWILMNLAWLLAMLADIGGWQEYQVANSRFAHSAGLLNSVWNLGLIDGPVRYAVKLVMALVWTLGPALVFVPRGITRLRKLDDGALLGVLLAASVVPSILVHLLVHFGSQGYAFHYVPALLAVILIGIGRDVANESNPGTFWGSGAFRVNCIAVSLALVFCLYPTNYSRPGWAGNFDLAFARYTRVGLRLPMPDQSVMAWRTVNSKAGGLKPPSYR